MKFRALGAELVPIATAARQHLADTEGARKFRAETELAPNLSYRPTFVGVGHDKGLIAVEVNEGRYTPQLDRLIVECQARGLPVRLFVAVPTFAPSGRILELLKKARAVGIGVLEVAVSATTTQLPALSLSLFGARPINKKRFPLEYHGRLNQAEETFRSGDPAKGCGRIYDLVEKHSRGIATRINQGALWRAAATRTVHKDKWFGSHSWANVLEYVEVNANFGALSSNGIPLTKPLWARVRGLTPHRNESGHEPDSLEELQDRDRQMRTRFEHAVDCLAELVAVHKSAFT